MSIIKTITLGCRFNVYESEVIKSILTSIDPEDDVVVINTCAVTQQAENQSKQAVRRAIKEYLGAKIIVTGCTLATSREYFDSLEGVYAVISNDAKTDINSYKKLPHNGQDTNISSQFSNVSFKNRVKVFLQIQCGCDNFCSYCIVPFARGRSRSMPVENILERIRFFISHGFKEIVLSGIDITSYNSAGLNFNSIIKYILDNIPELKRLRISSVNPHGIDDEFIELMRNTRIMPHLHLSIQSGDDNVLKAMRRKYTVAELNNIICKLKKVRPDIVLGADVIAGFPTETQRQFENSCSYIENSGLTLLHVFPYSPRPGTVASHLIQLPRSEILNRATAVRNIATKLKSAFQYRLIGSKTSGLVEKRVGNCSLGRTDNFLEFQMNKAIPINTLVENRNIIAIQDGRLLLD